MFIYIDNRLIIKFNKMCLPNLIFFVLEDLRAQKKNFIQQYYCISNHRAIISNHPVTWYENHNEIFSNCSSYSSDRFLISILNCYISVWSSFSNWNLILKMPYFFWNWVPISASLNDEKIVLLVKYSSNSWIIIFPILKECFLFSKGLFEKRRAPRASLCISISMTPKGLLLYKAPLKKRLGWNNMFDEVR